MVPKLVLFANLFGLFLVDAFLAADVRITQTLPASMAPGSEVRVNVTVEKGELSGFAKFQLDMPPGLSVTAIETKGASFTFADGKAKFIWMSLPPGPSFKFSYTLSADASARGALPIAGRLSYIEDNERKTHELPPSPWTSAAAARSPTAPPRRTQAAWPQKRTRRPSTRTTSFLPLVAPRPRCRRGSPWWWSMRPESLPLRVPVV